MASAPYGTWKSPISAEAITKNANSYEGVLVDAVTGLLYHLERRPSENGRTVLVATSTGKDVVPSSVNVRTGVQEYGGSPALVHDSVVYYSDYADGRVYKLKVDDKGGAVGEAEAITPADKPYRYANLALHPTHPSLMVSILEDHTNDTPSTVVTSLCLINTTTKTLLSTSLLSATFVDFYALPRFSPDGKKLAWMQWNHPDMPWNGAEIHIADVSLIGSGSDVSLEVKNPKRIAGEKSKISACYPLWASPTLLLFTSDESGFVNPWVYDAAQDKSTPLFAKPINEDFAKPMWSLGESNFAFVDLEGGAQAVVFTAIREGRDVVYFGNLEGPNHVGGGHASLLENFPLVTTSSVRAAGNGKVVLLGGSGDEKTAIYQLSVRKNGDQFQGELSKVPLPSAEADGGVKLPKEMVSPARPITLDLKEDGPLHVVFYPPHNPDYSGSSVKDEKPPCVVNVHGGPTSYVSQALDWRKQYFTSRGWAWVDVNYRGSSGYGRDYISKLDANWGVVDIQDCISTVRHLSGAEWGLVDPKRCTIRGGSAGGYTTLASISLPEREEDRKVFSAAQSSYGICDLRKLAEFTHKFESRYLERLMIGSRDGKSEEEVEKELEELYQKRSPIGFVENIEVPLLILQGADDKVVPREQADLIYAKLKEKGTSIVEYKVYEGEGHGWRKEENLRDSLIREREFYERVFGFKGEE
ncbi:alpha/beta-hydrolase [Coprinopsis sp. MPI-PUGE-AT-0042]|nr:alpha/beta-hydrolase [Coprinopsis sp. MPI-PUGE-AT-0042]